MWGARMPSIPAIFGLSTVAFGIGAVAMLLTERPIAAEIERPFGGPPPKDVLVDNRCYTPIGSCRMRLTKHVGRRCYCRIDGERIRGRVR
jgi:hypothetical protein